MTVVTIDGQIGAGAPEVGRRVAKMLSVDYYDRLLLTGVARRLGATVAAVQAKERRMHRWTDRFRSLFERAMIGLAMSAGAGEPYFAGMYPEHLPLTWDESIDGPRTQPYQLSNGEIAAATADQILEVARRGGAVIVHRAGCIELKDRPDTLKVGLFAPWDRRVWRMMLREGFLHPDDAQAAIRERERSQVAYFRQQFGVHPHDESLYDVRVDTARFDLRAVAESIVQTVRNDGAAVPVAVVVD